MVTKEKQILGIIQEKTASSIKVLNTWIKFFDSDLLIDFDKDDNVEVIYTDNVKDNRTYHNGKSIKLREESKPVNILLPKLKSDTTINCLLMQSVQLAISKELTLEQATSEIINCYKRITEI